MFDALVQTVATAAALAALLYVTYLLAGDVARIILTF